MAIKMLVLGGLLDHDLEFPQVQIAGESMGVAIKGAIGEWNNITHLVLELSRIQWVVGMDEVQVINQAPCNMEDKNDGHDIQPANLYGIEFRYVGSDEKLMEAVRAYCIAVNPRLRNILGLPVIPPSAE